MGHTGAYIINSFFSGSSPPMLGIPLSAPGGDLSKWFIPTYVGHTTPWRSFCPARPVHPHIRGAYPQCGHLWHQRSRFIPTYVGHTATVAVMVLMLSGSSPHTWGIQAVNLLRPQIIRFIPTYVGHTPGSRCPAHCGSVHPHIRGAYAGVQHIQRLHFRFIPTYVGHTVYPPFWM